MRFIVTSKKIVYDFSTMHFKFTTLFVFMFVAINILIYLLGKCIGPRSRFSTLLEKKTIIK